MNAFIVIVAESGRKERVSTSFSLGMKNERVYAGKNGQTYLLYTSCPLFRNLLLGYECGRVFPAGVGPGLPSRDAANWLPSQLSRSVEMRQRYGWLRIMFTRCTSSELQFCALWEVMVRERQGALSRKARSIR